MPSQHPARRGLICRRAPSHQGGDGTPASVQLLSEIASDLGPSTEITDGQRNDMLGAKKQDPPSLWGKLVAALCVASRVGTSTGRPYISTSRASAADGAPRARSLGRALR